MGYSQGRTRCGIVWILRVIAETTLRGSGEAAAQFMITWLGLDLGPKMSRSAARGPSRHTGGSRGPAGVRGSHRWGERAPGLIGRERAGVPGRVPGDARDLSRNQVVAHERVELGTNSSIRLVTTYTAHVYRQGPCQDRLRYPAGEHADSAGLPDRFERTRPCTTTSSSVVAAPAACWPRA